MGEGHYSAGESLANQRLTVREAADRLGISEAAVRNRIKRGSLQAERESGRVYVLLAGVVHRDESTDESTDKPTDESELVAVLREQLAAEREANRENRRIIAGLIERIPELEAPQEPQNQAESVSEDEDRVERRPRRQEGPHSVRSGVGGDAGSEPNERRGYVGRSRNERYLGWDVRFVATGEAGRTSQVSDLQAG